MRGARKTKKRDNVFKANHFQQWFSTKPVKDKSAQGVLIPSPELQTRGGVLDHFRAADFFSQQNWQVELIGQNCAGSYITSCEWVFGLVLHDGGDLANL